MTEPLEVFYCQKQEDKDGHIEDAFYWMRVEAPNAATAAEHFAENWYAWNGQEDPASVSVITEDRTGCVKHWTIDIVHDLYFYAEQKDPPK